MATSQPIYDGSKREHDRDESSVLENAHLKSVEPNRLSIPGPQYRQSRKSGPTDRDLLPSRCLRKQGMDTQVQPTDNPYHWETPAKSRNDNISSWVKASWTRTNEIVRQRAGTLSRQMAVRRSHERRVSLLAHNTHPHVSHHEQVMPKAVKHRAFSFEDEEPRNGFSTTLEELKEKDALSSTMIRVDSGVAPLSGRRSTLERPRIARTFSEILGSGDFVPTALLEGG